MDDNKVRRASSKIGTHEIKRGRSQDFFRIDTDPLYSPFRRGSPDTRQRPRESERGRMGGEPHQDPSGVSNGIFGRRFFLDR